jgi:hypothetical protein
MKTGAIRALALGLLLLAAASPAAAHSLVASGACPAGSAGLGFGPGTTCWRTDTNVLQVWDGQAWQSLLTQSSTSGAGAAQSVLNPGTVTFATLPSPSTQSNGGLLYCSDCVIAGTCAGGGTGALAKIIAGAWVCN